MTVNGNNDDDDGGYYCQLVALIPFSDVREGPPESIRNEGVDYYGYGEWPDRETLEKASFSLMATVEMAVNHFNDRNDVIVRELSELKGSCNIRIPPVIYRDSQYSRSSAVGALLDIVRSRHEQEVLQSYIASGQSMEQSLNASLNASLNESLNASLNASVEEPVEKPVEKPVEEPVEESEGMIRSLSSIGNAGKICSVIGPSQPRASEGVSSLTESLDIPQVIYSTMDRRLSRRDNFPTLARTVTSSQDFGLAIASFVDLLQRGYLAVVYDSSDYGEQYEDPLEDAEQFLGYSTLTEGFLYERRETLRDALLVVRQEGYHTVLLAADMLAVLDDVAAIADELGLIGPDYFWLFPGDMLSPPLLPTLHFPLHSAPDRLLRGAAVFTHYDPFLYSPSHDAFLAAWRAQNDSLARHVNNFNPLNRSIYPHEDITDYFANNDPTTYSSFLYDSIMLAGISACHAHQPTTHHQPQQQQQSNNATTEKIYSSSSHVNQVFETQFQGASGFVHFSLSEDSSELRKGKLNGRDVSGVTYGMYNVRPKDIIDNQQSYELVLTHIYTNQTDDNPKKNASPLPIPGQWIPLPNTSFLFYDGTTQPPHPIKTTVDYNYLSPSIHIVGMILFSLSTFITIGTLLWVYLHRKTPIIKASQPEFLCLLCIGAAMTGSSLFFLSWDERLGKSTSTLSAYCSIFLWLFVIGYQVMFLALYFKMWRLSKLLSLRRQSIQIKQALKPLAAVISCTIAVLITWQIIDPFTWDRKFIHQDNDDPWVSYGECNSSNYSMGVLPYLLPLAFMVAITVLMTGILSWKMKDVQSELAESRWIFFAIFMHVQVWAIGIPLFLILDEVSRDASYMINAGLIFIFSTSLVILIIWPKIYIWFRDTFVGGPPSSSSSSTMIRISVGQTRTVVSGMAPNSRSSSSSPFHKKNNDAAVHKRRIQVLEQELEQMRSSHEKETLELKSLVEDLKGKLTTTTSAETTEYSEAGKLTAVELLEMAFHEGGGHGGSRRGGDK